MYNYLCTYQITSIYYILFYLLSTIIYSDCMGLVKFRNTFYNIAEYIKKVDFNFIIIWLHNVIALLKCTQKGFNIHVKYYNKRTYTK
ncbi:hypothetical protein DAF78_12775 [Clostridioides difficile]|nr:hypothetical protein [Clostridioides difficile]